MVEQRAQRAGHPPVVEQRAQRAGVETTVRDLLLARADDAGDGLLFEDERHSWAEVVRQGHQRAAALRTLLDDERPPHVGVLLENTPDFLLTLGAAALGGLVVVGLNPTRRGEALAADVRRTDCQLVLTDADHTDLLDGLDERTRSHLHRTTRCCSLLMCNQEGRTRGIATGLYLDLGLAELPSGAC